MPGAETGLVQSRRDKQAAKRLLRKLLKKQGQVPRVMITDKLASYSAATRELMPDVEHRRDHVTAAQHRTACAQAFATWAEVTGAKAAA